MLSCCFTGHLGVSTQQKHVQPPVGWQHSPGSDRQQADVHEHGGSEVESGGDAQEKDGAELPRLALLLLQHRPHVIQARIVWLLCNVRGIDEGAPVAV